jgi:hypothetical protein
MSAACAAMLQAEQAQAQARAGLLVLEQLSPGH